MEKRIRDRIKIIEKLELELLSDEEIAEERKETLVLVEALHQELLRRIIAIAALVVFTGICLVGFLANPTPLNLIALVMGVLLAGVAIVLYFQKTRTLNDLFKALDKLHAV